MPVANPQGVSPFPLHHLGAASAPAPTPHSRRRRALVSVLLGALCLGALATAAAQQGRLEPGDAQLGSGEYLDVYFHEGRAGEQLTIVLSSDDFDPYVIVLAPDGSELLQVDDSPGAGLGVNVTLELPQTGQYTVAVTSAFASETGAYTLTLQGAGRAQGAGPARGVPGRGGTATPPATSPPATNPQAPPPNPLAPPQTAAPATSPLAGSFAGEGITLLLRVAGSVVSGTLGVGGAEYDVEGTVEGTATDATFRGTFGDAGGRFELRGALQGNTLLLESGGASYALTRTGAPATQVPAPNPLQAPPASAPVAAPPAAAVTVPAGIVTAPGPRGGAPRPAGEPVPGIGPRPGFVTGTVFDTQGRPLAGAGVLISGTTYVQGQQTSFETVTGPDGTYAVRVPDGRYGAKAWIDVRYQGVTFSRLLHPLSGNANSQIDSEVGGTLDFQWVLTGMIAPPGDDGSDYYGASIDLSYCGLPADAYCSLAYEAFPGYAVAPGGSTVRVTLVPVAPLIDGSQGETLHFEFTAQAQDPEYPYGGAPNAPAGYEAGGGGRLALGERWEYHSDYLFDIPLGVYDMSAVAILPDGRVQGLKLGLDSQDVEHATVRVSFAPWDDYSGRAYSGGGLKELDVYIRD